jgi:hypothetical protein
MDNALNALLSWQFILFSLGIFAIVWTFRTIVEYIFPKVIGKDLWEKLVLPLLPLGLGLTIAKFAVHYAYPDGLTSFSGRELFGLVAGMFSGLIYQVVKGMLKNKIQSYMYPYPYPVYPTPPAIPAPIFPTAPTTTSTTFPQAQQSAPSYDPAMEETVGGVGGKQP